MSTLVKEHDLNCLCGAKMRLKPSKYGYFYGCETYPSCEISVGAHQATGEPLGTPADKETKAARIKAHNAFDQLWMGGPINWKRTDCYSWMQRTMGLPEDQAHIGRFTKEQCQKLYEHVLFEFTVRGFKLLDKPPPKPEKK